MAVCRDCCTYGNYFAQCFAAISVTKKIVVQRVESAFINKLFQKLAARSSRHTFIIQYRKNSTTGNIMNRYQ
jgi:hypothetical protein